MDHAFTDSQKMYARLSMNNTPHNRPSIYGPELRVASPVLGDDQLNQRQTVVNYTNLLGPSLVLELSSSFLRYSIQRRRAAPSMAWAVL